MPTKEQRPRQRLSVMSWATLAYLVVVVLWGAFVRATGSGAGCGSHWPLCNGTVMQRAPSLATIIELSHRATSGLSLILVGTLTVLVFRAFPRGHGARQGAVVSCLILLLEAALGAGLVLLELVAHNDSAMRAVAVAVHLVNTFLLLASLTYTAMAVTQDRRERFAPKGGRTRLALVGAGLFFFLVVGAAGAIVALGDTLFPVSSLAEGLRQDFSPAAHFLIRLRLLHPVLAVASALYLVFLCSYLRLRDVRPGTTTQSRRLVVLISSQVVLGIANLLFLAPVPMQLAHLALADLTWIVLVMVAVETLTAPAPVVARAAERALKLVRDPAGSHAVTARAP